MKILDFVMSWHRFLVLNSLCVPILPLSAHLKGCIDPTGKLPENKVFISGFVKSPENGCGEIFGKVYEKVFISRSPCLEPGDAKLLKVVGNKPKCMTLEEWNQLCSYSFGTIIFPQSREFDPLACVIAGRETNCFFSCFSHYFHIMKIPSVYPLTYLDGDLDGDGEQRERFLLLCIALYSNTFALFSTIDRFFCLMG